jgi:rhamnosyltransferase
MIADDCVAAVVVTYHPRAEDLHNLRKLRAQVDLLIVVDNGSNENDLVHIRCATREHGAKFIENGKNLGIAVALNLGVRKAQHEGCRWVALFDQDSEVTEGFIATMVADFQVYSLQENILQIVPRYLDPSTGLEQAVSSFGDGGAFLTITSGSVFSIEAFEKCGLFREDLFIYCVDDDYSLRLRKNGFFIGVSKNAVLLHRCGRPTFWRIFGRTIETKNYRPEVCYYYARNKVWILRAYGGTFPRLIVPTLREFMTIPTKIALMEDAPWEKILHFFHGLQDGVAGRMGPMSRAEFKGPSESRHTGSSPASVTGVTTVPDKIA